MLMSMGPESDDVKVLASALRTIVNVHGYENDRMVERNDREVGCIWRL